MKGPQPGSFSYEEYVRQVLYSAKVLQTLMVNGIRDHSRFQPFKDYWNFVGNENVVVGLYSVAVALEKVEELKNDAGAQLITSVRKIALRLQRTVSYSEFFQLPSFPTPSTEKSEKNSIFLKLKN